MKICFVGFGEVGRIYAQALWEAGETVGHVCDQHLSSAGHKLAHDIGANIEDAPGSWLNSYDTVISAVTGKVALEIAKTCALHLRKGALYIDLTTASPHDMQAAEAHVRKAGIQFVDVGILGAVSIRKGKTALVASGVGVEEFAPIAAKLGASLKKLPGSAGDAVRLKLLRSIFTKGLEALAVETLVAAEAQGLRQEFFDVVADIDQMPLQQTLEVFVCTHVIHARRRHYEVLEAAAQMRNIGIDPLITEGVGELFERSSNARSARDTADTPDIDAALKWLHGVCQDKSPTSAHAF